MTPVSGQTPPGQLTRRASLNTFASMVEWVVRLLVGFVINPVLVSGLGSFAYGVWQVLQQIVGYMSAAGGRPSQALKWSIAKLQVSSDVEQKRRQVGSSLIVAVLFLPVLVPIGLCVAWFCPGWLDTPPDMVWPVRLAAALIVLNPLLMNFLDVPRSVLEGENLAYRLVWISAFVVCVWGVLAVLAVNAGLGLPGVALALLATTVLTGSLYFLVVRRHVRWFRSLRPGPEELRAFLGLSGWFLAWRLVMQVLRSSDVIALGIADSAEMVSVYALTRYVPEALVMVVSMIVIGAAPGLGGLIGAGEVERCAAVRSEVMSFTWLFATIAGVGIVLWNEDFIRLWVGAEFFAGEISNLLIVLLATQFAFVRTDAHIIDLTLELRKKVQFGALASVLAVGLGVGLVLLGFGIAGLCAGFLVGRGILTILYPILVGRTLSIPPFAQLRATIRPAAATFLLLGISIVVSRHVRAVEWVSLVGASLLTVVAAVPIAFFAGLSRSARLGLIRRTRRILETLGEGGVS